MTSKPADGGGELRDVLNQYLEQQTTKLETVPANAPWKNGYREALKNMSHLLASLPPLGRGEGWQPIESAPIDGTIVDLWCRSPGINGGGFGRIPDCWCSVGKWYRYDEQHGDDMCRTRVHNATHWMSRPDEPMTSHQQAPK